MRSVPAKPAGTKRTAQVPDKRSYQFLTYVFGGGVKVNDHEKHRDSVTPVRGASVRGQLRFWWRACNPSECKTLDELRQREEEIWGTTSQASKVEIAVLSQPAAPKIVQVFEYNEKRRIIPCKGMKELAYGAFPLQPSRDAQRSKAQPGTLFDHGSSKFSLRFTYPEVLRKDVEAALWAWETFGGLGGRTRRGFGAIQRADVEGTAGIEPKLSSFTAHPRIAGVPSLRHARFATARRSCTTSLNAWVEGLGLLQSIRQGEYFGRNERPKNSKKPAGRSLWPEPDEIRSLTGKSAPLHKNPVVQVSRFPRAAFGMPIVFHFNPGSQDEPGSAGDPDMKPLQLEPVGFERFASPLIIRPIPDGDRFYAAALVLSSDIPDSQLVAGEEIYPVDWRLDPNLAKAIPPLNRNGTTYVDPIELFLSELKK
jgi:CRISPR-associated protein Cmr1